MVLIGSEALDSTFGFIFSTKQLRKSRQDATHANLVDAKLVSMQSFGNTQKIGWGPTKRLERKLSVCT